MYILENIRTEPEGMDAERVESLQHGMLGTQCRTAHIPVRNVNIRK